MDYDAIRLCLSTPEKNVLYFFCSVLNHIFIYIYIYEDFFLACKSVQINCKMWSSRGNTSIIYLLIFIRSGSYAPEMLCIQENYIYWMNLMSDIVCSENRSNFDLCLVHTVSFKRFQVHKSDSYTQHLLKGFSDCKSDTAPVCPHSMLY